MTGMDILEWIKRHPDWFVFGRWNEARYACRVKLKPAGRAALAARTDDMSPIYGGMVEPGWQCIPAKPKPTKKATFTRIERPKKFRKEKSASLQKLLRK